MFELETAIEDWRRQMTGSGIKTAAVLDELESHLREAIEQEMSSGLTGQQAFEFAVRSVGQADALKTEFAKTGGVFGFLNDKSARTNCILGVLWLAGCSGSLYTNVRQFISPPSPGASPDVALWLMNAMGMIIYAAGIVGSISLFWGAKLGRRLVRMLALLMAIVCVAQALNFQMPAAWRMWCGVVAVFSLVSIWLLHAPRPADLNPNTTAN